MTKELNAPIFWFTGLSGAGKTTIAEGVKKHLEEDGLRVLILDGDDVRNRLHRHLGFSESDIRENNALIAQLCANLRGRHDVILVPIISPYAESRKAAKEELSPGFFEVFCRAGLDIVAERDVKGLYAKAQQNEMDNLIGYSPGYPYEEPENPDVILDSGAASSEETIEAFYKLIKKQVKANRQNISAGVS